MSYHQIQPSHYNSSRDFTVHPKLVRKPPNVTKRPDIRTRQGIRNYVHPNNKKADQFIVMLFKMLLRVNNTKKPIQLTIDPAESSIAGDYAKKSIETFFKFNRMLLMLGCDALPKGKSGERHTLDNGETSKMIGTFQRVIPFLGIEIQIDKRVVQPFQREKSPVFVPRVRNQRHRTILDITVRQITD